MLERDIPGEGCGCTLEEVATDAVCQGMLACARIRLPVDVCGRPAAMMMDTVSDGGLCRNGMTQERAVQLYTGSHWRVEAATLADVEHFTKFAVSLALPWLFRRSCTISQDHLRLLHTQPYTDARGCGEFPVRYRQDDLATHVSFAEGSAEVKGLRTKAQCVP